MTGDTTTVGGEGSSRDPYRAAGEYRTAGEKD
jgi:hypothetical protein